MEVDDFQFSFRDMFRQYNKINSQLKTDIDEIKNKNFLDKEKKEDKEYTRLRNKMYADNNYLINNILCITKNRLKSFHKR